MSYQSHLEKILPFILQSSILTEPQAHLIREGYTDGRNVRDFMTDIYNSGKGFQTFQLSPYGYWSPPPRLVEKVLKTYAIADSIRVDFTGAIKASFPGTVVVYHSNGDQVTIYTTPPTS